MASASSGVAGLPAEDDDELSHVDKLVVSDAGDRQFVHHRGTGESVFLPAGGGRWHLAFAGGYGYVHRSMAGQAEARWLSGGAPLLTKSEHEDLGAINQSINHQSNQLNQPNQYTNQTISQSNQSNDQSINKPANQRINQFTNQSVSWMRP